MVAYNVQHLLALLTNCTAAATNHLKGEAMADLVQYAFEEVPGITLLDRNNVSPDGAMETDLVFAHRSDTSGLQFFGVSIRVECKNEQTRISAAQVREFAAKLKRYNAPTGVMVSRTGLSGSPGSDGHSAIEAAQQDGRNIIVLQASELAKLSTTGEMVELLYERIQELDLHGTYVTI